MEDNENLRQKYEQKRQEVKRITELLYGSSGGPNFNDNAGGGAGAGTIHPDLMASGGVNSASNYVQVE